MTTEVQVLGLSEFARWGCTLQHLDDHILLLLHEGERIATFSQTGATGESLQAECANRLVMKHGWDGSIWNRKEDKYGNTGSVPETQL